MRTKTSLPQIGTQVWVAVDHYYYLPDQAGPCREFAVCPGKVVRHNTAPSREPEAVISYQSADGVECLLFVRRSCLKYNCFETPREAAMRAKAQTDKFESSCLGQMFHEKLRRPWEGLLKDKE